MKKIILLISTFLIYNISYWDLSCWLNSFEKNNWICSCIEWYIWESEDESNLNCINKKKINSYLNECYFNWKYYKLPSDASCTNNRYNAWLCNSWYYEKGNKCIKKNNNCNIKWNISYNSKTKVYYLPECWKYNEVKIDEKYWERWFCSEKEAVDAWWIKSYRCPSKYDSSNILKNNTKEIDNNIKNKNEKKIDINKIMWISILIQIILIFIIKYNQWLIWNHIKIIDIVKEIILIWFLSLIMWSLYGAFWVWILDFYTYNEILFIYISWTIIFIWYSCFSNDEKGKKIY